MKDGENLLLEWMHERDWTDASPLRGPSDVFIVHVVVSRDRTILPKKPDPFRAMAHSDVHLPFKRHTANGVLSIHPFRGIENRVTVLNMTDQTAFLLTFLVFVVMS